MPEIETAAGIFQNQELFSNAKVRSGSLKDSNYNLGEESQSDDLFLALPSNSPFYLLGLQDTARSRNQVTLNVLVPPETDAYHIQLSQYGDCRSRRPALQSPPLKKPNNPNGRKGIPRCETCRKDKRKVSLFDIWAHG